MARSGTARRATSGVAALGISLTGVVAGTSPAHAATIQVINTNDDGPGSLRDALDRAQEDPADDHITFAPSAWGTIAVTGGELEAVIGGGSGSLTIEGPGSDALGIDAGGQSRVLDVHGSGDDPRPTLVISRLTLTGGDAKYETTQSFGQGGALRVIGADAILDRIEVSDSQAEGFGGGVSVERGNLTVTASTVADNTAISGGGIYVDAGEATGAELVIGAGSTVRGNTASQSGGGIHSPGPVTVRGSTVSGNTAAFSQLVSEGVILDGVGGGISGGDVAVVASSVTGNGAQLRGGGVAGQRVDVVGSTIARNVAHEQGGGVHADQARLESSTVTGNRADVGGGLHVASDVPVELILSTVAANAAVSGGGLFSTSAVAVQGTSLAMNAGGDVAGDGVVTQVHSLVGEDPLLGPLGDHGGRTETLLPASNSPVIDQGSAFGSTTDQRGLPRPVDDPTRSDAADGSDIGAVELIQQELAGPPQVANTARPTILGKVRVGETLRTDGGTWEGEGVPLSYQWLRGGVPIPGATSRKYTLTPDDYGRNLYGDDNRKRISVRVTAEPEGPRPAVALSDYTDHVARGVLTMDGRPRVIGEPTVGSVLRARPRLGAVSPRPDGVWVNWFLDGRQIGRAAGEKRLMLTPRMRGQRVKTTFIYYPPPGYRRLTRVVRMGVVR